MNIFKFRIKISFRINFGAKNKINWKAINNQIDIMSPNKNWACRYIFN